MEDVKPHFLLITFPVQGHINPGLQLAKQLIWYGANVTFVTNVVTYNRIYKDYENVPKGLAFITISDGYNDNFSAKSDKDGKNHISNFNKHGVETLETLFKRCALEGKQVTCLVHSILIPWAAEVARKFCVPSALLWIQSAATFDIYYYYFNGFCDAIKDCEEDPLWSLQLPNLPLSFKVCDLPSFFLPSSPSMHNFAFPLYKEQIDDLKKEEKPKILVNLFEALEVDVMKSIERFSLIPIGPLLPLAFLDGKHPLDKSFGADLFQSSKDTYYIKWLNSQEERSSVIYVSFGSMLVLSKPQMEELAQALIQAHKPFLWVVRDFGDKEKNSQYELSCMEELKQQGLYVPWCSQIEVLSHPSVGCFMTHGGWNSILESLTNGVPMVVFPHMYDQITNAKLVEDAWKIGVRVKVSEEEGGLVMSREIKRCLMEVLESEEMRENAKKWRQLALEAVQEGGSSNKNLKRFVEELTNVDCQKK